MENCEKISFEALRSAEIEASEKNVHISSVAKPDGGELNIITEQQAMSLVRRRPINAHKGTFGKLICVTGSERFPGAAQISSLAALRSGVGLVKVFSTPLSCHALAVNAKEATLFPCPADKHGFIYPDDDTLSELIRSVKTSSAVLIGCGLGTNDGSLMMLEAVLENAGCPIIIDADGINLVCRRIELLRKARTEVILTPHPAELGRLVGVSLDETVNNRYRLSKELSEQYGVTVVSKSCATVIVSNSGDCVLWFGNDGLSKGGSGDLLAGLISSFAAQGLTAQSSAILGCAMLGLGCEAASRELSKTGMLASDIINCLPKLFKKFERA